MLVPSVDSYMCARAFPNENRATTVARILQEDGYLPHEINYWEGAMGFTRHALIRWVNHQDSPEGSMNGTVILNVKNSALYHDILQRMDMTQNFIIIRSPINDGCRYVFRVEINPDQIDNYAIISDNHDYALHWRFLLKSFYNIRLTINDLY